MSFILYHGFIHLKYGNDSCKWLLSDGRFQSYNAWQPYGCMVHQYTKSESRNCMHYISYWGGKNHITFLGDSRIRQLYYGFVKLVSTDDVKTKKAHSDLHFRDDRIKLSVDFLWEPMVDESMCNQYKRWIKKDLKNRPNLVVTGSSTWSIKKNNGSKDALENFKVNLTYIFPYFNKLKNTTKVLWMLQDPVVESKLSANRSMITNAQIDDYNRAAIDILYYTSADIWSSSRLVAQGYNSDTPDGLHIGDVALNWDSQILMNMYCNDHMNFNDGTCCSAMEPITTMQLITAVIFGLSLLIALVLLVYKRKARRCNKNGCKLRSASNSSQSDSEESLIQTPEGDTDNQPFLEWFYELMVALAKFGLILGYFFLCDRTNFFMKENKYYTHVNFFLPFSYLMILGFFFFTEDSDQTRVLHRDQTDEWKGWMQLVILIYHLTGATKVLSIYMHIRMLVSGYLFLSGFGHFYYFWNKGDYALFRFCKVLFRYNFLVVMLCFVMNRPYQFYYFIPLVSYWFLLLYLTMAIWPQVTATSADANAFHYLYMVLKIVVLVVVMTLLYASEVLFEKIFLTHPFKSLFVQSDDSINEWRFRWQLDRYSVLYGMVFAFALLVAQKFKLIDETKSYPLFSKGISWIVCILAALGLLAYGIFSAFCRNKTECNDVHPYISFLPIISYVVLRNVPGWLRTKYSTFFAWFGRISLELFIAQYHIWLAADTHGILVFIPGYPVLNIIITSFIFVCAAHEISKLTATLSTYAIPKDWKLLLRNIVCFVAILLPVAITHGSFGF